MSVTGGFLKSRRRLPIRLWRKSRKWYMGTDHWCAFFLGTVVLVLLGPCIADVTTYLDLFLSWNLDRSKKAPMELINEVPPIQVEGRIFACEGDNNPALGYPIEFICLDLEQPVIRKYCGLRYVQDHHY
ncbi:hypothetical protein IFM89_033686 [Coptis chinensis]|uniref:Zinc finger CHCC-type domain-containing protein n=1 Tax=Coptis chinensis TaxID=261450 RepID=A0A835LPQ7_9MAGN|nr:hypothetical protein IFM89_033686 [Coptis chinensis]